TSIYNDGQAGPLDGITVESIANLKTVSNQVIVICADAEKELLLEQILPKINGEPKILLAGYAHYEYQNPTFKKIKESLAVPSIANGYENCLIHLFQCIENGIKNNLQGDVVEFGTFQGGTTKFLAKTVKALGGSAKIWTFDTFEGFPSKESPLDLYNHEDLGNTNLQEVQNYLQNENVEIVPGDIRDTVQVLEEIPIQLAFMDTDNYSAATAALATIAAQIVPGGAIVFDHYTGHNRFRYTIGERIAAKTLENDSRFINLHGTGVFIKLKE
ncbi:MAG: TylF/MycF/NovP-related O-methyltransferase, partial [Thermoplasmatota archaeon]